MPPRPDHLIVDLHAVVRKVVPSGVRKPVFGMDEHQSLGTLLVVVHHERRLDVRERLVRPDVARAEMPEVRLEARRKRTIDVGRNIARLRCGVRERKRPAHAPAPFIDDIPLRDRHVRHLRIRADERREARTVHPLRNHVLALKRGHVGLPLLHEQIAVLEGMSEGGKSARLRIKRNARQKWRNRRFPQQ